MHHRRPAQAEGGRSSGVCGKSPTEAGAAMGGFAPAMRGCAGSDDKGTPATAAQATAQAQAHAPWPWAWPSGWA